MKKIALGFSGMLLFASLFLAGGIGGCESSPAPRTQNKADTLHQEVMSALDQFNRRDPSLQKFLDGSHAYAVFPNVSSGAVGVGGAYGRGEVYQNGKFIGYSDLSQANIGVQLGGQSYSEIVAFQNASTFDQFRNGKLDFDARASAVAASSGAAAAADYQKGVAVFSLTQSGLMFQAAIGGQNFRFESSSGMASEK